MCDGGATCRRCFSPLTRSNPNPNHAQETKFKNQLTYEQGRDLQALLFPPDLSQPQPKRRAGDQGQEPAGV